jgi:hypothetical protein
MVEIKFRVNERYAHAKEDTLQTALKCSQLGSYYSGMEIINNHRQTLDIVISPARV